MIKVDRTYLPVNMTLALFHKHLQKNRNILERGLGGQGPGPDPFGLAWGARVLGRTLLVWLGGPGSWAGPFWFGLGARVLGRTGLYD